MGLRLWGADTSLVDVCAVEGARGSETLVGFCHIPALRVTSCRDEDQLWSLLVVPLSVHPGAFSKVEDIQGQQAAQREPCVASPRLTGVTRW